MNTLMRCLQIAYGMVEAIEIEQIEKDIRKLEEQVAQEEHLGYKQPGDTHTHKKPQSYRPLLPTHRP